MKYHLPFTMKKLLFFATFSLPSLFGCHAQNPAFQNLTVNEFRQKMTDPNVVVLDVRTPEETYLGKIEGAQELDFRNPNFAEEVEKLDKSKTYLVYCRSGARSEKACNLMAEKGFPLLFNLKGGYLAWTNE
jgi:rhodanese-related sulfurtransferase